MARVSTGTGAAIEKFLNELPADVYQSTKTDDVYDLLMKDKAVCTAMKIQSLSESSIKQKIGKIKKDRGFSKARKSKAVSHPSSAAAAAGLTLNAAFAIVDQIKEAGIMPIELLQMQKKLEDNDLDLRSAVEALVKVSTARDELEQQRLKFAELFPEEKSSAKKAK